MIQFVFDPQKFDFDDVTAMGDIGFDVRVMVSTEETGFLWAFGMVGTLPTATDDDVGGEQLRLGPESLIAKFEKWGIWGFFPSHQWDVTGGETRTINSNSQLQLFARIPAGRRMDHWNQADLKLRLESRGMDRSAESVNQ